MRFPFILTAIAAAGALAAQTVPPVTSPVILPSLAPPIAELKQYLNLTDSQVASLEGLLQQRSLAQQQIASQMAQKSLTLQSLLAAASPNPAAVGQAYIDIQNLEKQLANVGTPFHTQALAVLTTSQTALLANLNTALQLQTTACEAVNLNLLTPPVFSAILGAIAVTGTTAVSSCPAVPSRIIPVFTPGTPGTTLPGGIAPPVPPQG